MDEQQILDGNNNAEVIDNQANDAPSASTGDATPEKKTYSKQQVAEIMRRRVERSHNSFYKRYGVENLEALDALFNKAKQFDSMNGEYASLKMKLDDVTRDNAFLRNNIDPERYEDVKTFFKGTGQDFSEEALLSALTNHPEWIKQVSNVVPQTTIETLGSNQNNKQPDDEKAMIENLFGVKLR